MIQKMAENMPLAPYTSMYVGGRARYFAEVDSVEALKSALSFAKEKGLPFFVLGGGSNILVSDKGFDGLVIYIKILGIKLLEENEEYAKYEIGAGENWDKFVEFAVGQKLYGIENMSHVPGNVGASVVQNIGCYGQEVSEIVEYIKAFDTISFQNVIIQNSDLQFSYRKSRLNDKNSDRGKYVVTHVIFRLLKNGEINMSYGDLQKYFALHKDMTPNLQTVREALISIRNKKYPYPGLPTDGTCGSFWNAEVIDDATYEKIISKLHEKGFTEKAEEMAKKKNVFKVAQGYKVPFGIFIEVLGFKGQPHGGAKVLETHSGVINNFTGTATAQDVFELSEKVINAVYQEFGVKLKMEPELVGEF